MSIRERWREPELNSNVAEYGLKINIAIPHMESLFNLVFERKWKWIGHALRKETKRFHSVTEARMECHETRGGGFSSWFELGHNEEDGSKHGK